MSIHHDHLDEHVRFTGVVEEASYVSSLLGVDNEECIVTEVVFEFEGRYARVIVSSAAVFSTLLKCLVVGV